MVYWLDRTNGVDQHILRASSRASDLVKEIRPPFAGRVDGLVAGADPRGVRGDMTMRPSPRSPSEAQRLVGVERAVEV